ncbi:MAG: glycosyltransferase [Kiritimatiellae bacterium]|nr:glycosyltransferase [Kiritimatiellia bacterium]
MVHHHLRRGGVTRVMYAHARILGEAGEEVMIFTGEAPADPVPEGVRIRVLPELGYRDDYSETEVENCLRALRSEAGADLLWHVHNHSLGKSPVYTAALCRMAAAGEAMVFQPHDFAEDGRPANLRLLRKTLPDFPRQLYPIGPHIRYAVLQARDAEILCKAGVPRDAVRLLPNPMSGNAELLAPADPPRRVLYLSRCIRRKNLGEFLLWAAKAGDELEFATSLIPENPGELPRFRRWRDLASDMNLPVQFGLGMAADKTFDDVAGWSDLCMTTSVGEGFGMSFLEPFLLDRPLFGRDLPEITAGFKADGVCLDALYPELPVPVDMLDDAFWPRALSSLQTWREAMEISDPLQLEHLQATWVREGRIDFGRLDEPAQESVLSQSDALNLEWPRNFPKDTRVHNRDRIAEAYGSEATLRRLQELYAGLQDAKPETTHADATQVRDAFLSLDGLSLLRS